MIRDSYPKTRCDECNQDTHVHNPKYVEDVDIDYAPREEYPQVMNGMVLDLLGGYGMFVDFMFDEPEREMTVLCHDCFLKVARALPNIFRAGTPYHTLFEDEDEHSCCEFSWTRTPDDQLLFGDGEGNWVSRDDSI